jgi:glycine betaine/proline transport system substrate-binding protein
MKRFKTMIGIAALAVSTALPAMAETIRMGTMSWEDLTPITAITRHVLEQKGHEVEVTEFSEWGIAYAALARGDIQIMASQVDYVAQDYWDRYRDRLEKISPVSHGLYQGIAVPTYVDVTSLEQLNDNADLFGGRIVGIESGSGLMRDAASAVDAYGLNLQLVEGSSAGMSAALQSAVDRQEPIAVTIWEPSWMMQKFDMRYLEDPQGVFPPPQGYYWIGQAGFSEQNPGAREAIASVYVPLADITALNGAVADGQTMDEAVSEWIGNHEDLITRWLNIKEE